MDLAEPVEIWMQPAHQRARHCLCPVLGPSQDAARETPDVTAARPWIHRRHTLRRALRGEGLVERLSDGPAGIPRRRGHTTRRVLEAGAETERLRLSVVQHTAAEVEIRARDLGNRH